MIPADVTGKPKAAISWSGGKDGYLAFRRTRQKFDFVALLTMFDEQRARSRSHGLRPEIIREQARLLGLQPFLGRCSWNTYTDEFVRQLELLRSSGITDIVFGDIFGDAHREWTEAVCRRAGLCAHEPLWAEPTSALVNEFLATGAQAQIITVNRKWLDVTFLGRTLAPALLSELAGRGADPAGENGEYHTLVTHAPEFQDALRLLAGQVVLKSNCWALDVILQQDAATQESRTTGAA